MGRKVDPVWILKAHDWPQIYMYIDDIVALICFPSHPLGLETGGSHLFVNCSWGLEIYKSSMQQKKFMTPTLVKKCYRYIYKKKYIHSQDENKFFRRCMLGVFFLIWKPNRPIYIQNTEYIIYFQFLHVAWRRWGLQKHFLKYCSACYISVYIYLFLISYNLVELIQCCLRITCIQLNKHLICPTSTKIYMYW